LEQAAGLRPSGEADADVGADWYDAIVLDDGRVVVSIVTAFIGIIDRGLGTLTFASAGHPPPLLYADGIVAEVKAFVAMLWNPRIV